MSDNNEMLTEGLEGLDGYGEGEYGPVAVKDTIEEKIDINDAADGDLSEAVSDGNEAGNSISGEAESAATEITESDAISDGMEAEADKINADKAEADATENGKDNEPDNTDDADLDNADSEEAGDDSNRLTALLLKKKRLIYVIAALLVIILIVLGNVIYQAVSKKNASTNEPTGMVTDLNGGADGSQADAVDNSALDNTADSNTSSDEALNDENGTDDSTEVVEDADSGDDENDESADTDDTDEASEDANEVATAPVVPAPSGTPVEVHGKLSVNGTQLVDCNGNAFQIKGVSTHGIAWFPQYVNYDAFKTLRDEWGVNCVRLAMYSGEYNGYCTGGNQSDLKNTVNNGVDYATQLGMYVIIDWHVLGDQNPNTYKDQAKSFFSEMSEKYAGYSNVLYEICNEPNGGTTWSDVKSYAEEVIPLIKANDPNAIIVVGTPTWSQDVNLAAADPITGYSNIMYALHFYADTHRDDLRNRMVAAINSGIPIFVTEFGICDASGSGANNYTEGDKWIQVMNQYNVSYNIWSLCNKNETASLISSSCSKTANWTSSELSDSGRWYVGVLGNNVDPGSGASNSNTDNTNSGNGSSNSDQPSAQEPATSTPAAPETPNTPSTPAAPETPSTPSTPAAPETPSTPSTPATPETPSTPSTPAAPETPSTPSTPAAPETPSTPSTPAAPETPSTPSTPDAPASTGTLAASITNSGNWSNGTSDYYQYVVKIEANGGDVSNWTVVINFGTSVSIDQSWNGNFTANGNSVTITPVDYNSTVASGTSYEVGLIVYTTGSIGTPTVTVQ